MTKNKIYSLFNLERLAALMCNLLGQWDKPQNHESAHTVIDILNDYNYGSVRFFIRPTETNQSEAKLFLLVMCPCFKI
jgi:hypothetical protein